MLLARKGHRVLLVDRAAFPSDIPRGHFIHRGGPARLSRWGVLDRILETGCPAVDTFVLDLAGFPLVGRNLVVNGVAFGCGPRRMVLDKVLVDAAIEAGVEFRDRLSVDDFLTENGRIVGISGREAGSRARFVARARLTIGADGRNSRLARTVAAVTYDVVPPLTCWYFSYWSGPFEKNLAIHGRNRRVIFSFPTNHNLQAIFIGWPADEFHGVRQDVDGHFMQVLRDVPELAERVESGRREERFYGTADVPNFYRKPFGTGWALVGDAGRHKDPIGAHGIADALRDAELLSDAAHEGLSRSRPIEEALATYEAQRDAASKADYEQNIQAARQTPLPEETRALFAALRGRDEDTRQFFLARQGLIPADRFFDPENIRRIMGGQAGVLASSPDRRHTLTALPLSMTTAT
jgi:2-polyprenyl-6-methoxyphenol hydroxylase-like FAD-dependent oxidoreductase